MEKEKEINKQQATSGQWLSFKCRRYYLWILLRRSSGRIYGRKTSLRGFVFLS